MQILSEGLALPAADTVVSRPWIALADASLVILVGLTGVGKSTTLTALEAQGVTFSLLPNRRTLTDDILIPAVQQADGLPRQTITDRVARFQYTARYRELYPGGMAHALSRLAIDPQLMPVPRLFDGLRGREEVMAAAELLPQSRFVVLEAADTVRLERLLQRGDAFDLVEGGAADQDVQAGLAAMPGIDGVFDAAARIQLARLPTRLGLSAEDLLQKVSIIVTERQNYDSQAALAFLQTLPAMRRLVVDTALMPPETVAAEIAAWL